MIKYHLPRRGKITRENAKELYWALLPYRCRQNSRFFIAWLLKGLSVDEAVSKIDQILPPKKAKKSEPESYEQYRALKNIIFGRHYSVETFENIMLLLAMIEEKERQEQARAIVPANSIGIKGEHDEK